MEYKSNKNSTVLLAGIILVAIGCFTLFLAYVAKGEANVLWLLGPSMLVLSAVCLTYQCQLVIDDSSQMVKKSVSTLGWDKTVGYFFTDFNKVEIITGGGTNAGRSYTTYIVHLAGSSNLCVPGGSENLEEQLEKGKQIAELIHIPFDEKPRMGFILNLWDRLC